MSPCHRSVQYEFCEWKGVTIFDLFIWKYRFVFEWDFEGSRFVFVNVEYNITKWKRDRKSIGLYIMAYHQCSQGPFCCRLFYYHPPFVPVSFLCYFSIFSCLFNNHFHVFIYLSKPISLFVQKVQLFFKMFYCIISSMIMICILLLMFVKMIITLFTLFIEIW